MADVAALVRQYQKRPDSVRFEGDEIVFPTARVARNAPSALKDHNGKPFDAQALWMLMTLRDEKFANYFGTCRKMGVGHVRIKDRKSVIDLVDKYVGGEAVSVAQKRAREEDEEDAPVAKRRKAAAAADLQPIVLTEEMMRGKEQWKSMLEELLREANGTCYVFAGDESVEEHTKAMRGFGTAAVDEALEPLPDDVRAFISADAPLCAAIRDGELPCSSRSNAVRSFTKEFKDVEKIAKDTSKRAPQLSRYDEERWEQKRLAGADALGINTLGSNDPSARARPRAPIPGNAPAPERQRPRFKFGTRDQPYLILVPAVPTAALNMWNAKAFLQHAEYIEPKEAKKQSKRKPTSVRVVHKYKGQEVHYEVTDQTLKFRTADWMRLAAVFAVGQQWQFKGWKWKEPVELFKHAAGFHLIMKDATVPEPIHNWNVKILEVSKEHVVKPLQMHFWDTIDEFLLAKERGK